MKRLSRPLRSLIGLLSLVGLASLVGAAQAAAYDRIAAVVNDEIITLSEVYDVGGEFINSSIEQQGGDPIARRAAELEVLDSLVLRKLIAQELTRLGFDVTEAEIDSAIDGQAQSNGMSRDQLRIEVERAGMGWSDYRAEARESLRQQKFTGYVIMPRIQVSDDELKDAYRRLIASTDLPEVTEVGAIFLPWPEGADDAVKATVMAKATAATARVRAGEDFAAVAASVDEGPFGAAGGKMGAFRDGELTPALDAIVSKLEPRQVSDAVELPQGCFVLYVFDRHASDVQPFEAVRDQMYNQVSGARVQDEIQQWYEQQRRKAAISVKLESSEGP